MSGFCHKHLLKLLDFTPAELNGPLQLTAKLRADKKSGKEEARLIGKNIVLIFEKDSIRTRCSFEVAVYDQDARVTHLGPSGSQIGHKEQIKDTVHVLGRMHDGTQYCGYGQEIVETLTECAGVPVWNGLTGELHPTQLLADLLATREHLSGEAFNEMTLIYAGDVRNNMGNSMLEAAALIGLDLRLAVLQACWSEAALVTECGILAQKHGGKTTLAEDIASGAKGVDLIYTDVWVSMGEPKEKQVERIALLRDYQVNSKMIAPTGNLQVKFLHCLPAFHDEQTTLDKKMAAEFGLYGGIEATDEVFESPASIVFDQVENRMRTTKVAMAAILAK